MSIKEKLVKIVGSDNYFDDPKTLDAYSKDFSLQPPAAPNYVVKPKDAKQIQQVVQLANELMLPVVPSSSEVHFQGATIPRQGGIVMDMTRLNKILEIDDFNRKVRVEAGVTWGQLTKELAKKGFRAIMPLLPHYKRSVVTDTLEREVPTTIVYDYGEPLQGMEVVWPTGEIFRTGSASVTGYPDTPSKGANPSGPGMDFYRFLQGAQGTMGAVTWANIKVEYIPEMTKILFSPVKDFENTIDFLYRVLRMRLFYDCILLNSTNLASIIAEDFDKDFEELRATLPEWTLILTLSGMHRYPEEQIGYQEEALNDVLRNEFPDIEIYDALPGFPGVARKLLSMIGKPWPKDVTYWKNRYQGGCHSLFFITKPVMASHFINTVQEIAARYDYPISDLGVYLQPIEHNRACHLEFNLYYDPYNYYYADQIRSLCNEIAPVLLEDGAIFSRPYGELAKLVYDKAESYTAALKRVKKVFDPKNIMNPGNLCF